MYKVTPYILIAILVFFTKIVQADTDYNASEILAKSEDIYANCKTYSDDGYVKTLFLDKKGKTLFATKLIFKTAFKRPSNFRFEYAEEQAGELVNRYIIWKSAKQLKSYWDIQGEETPKSLPKAIYAATGVSGGSALNISSLLISEVRRKTMITHSEKPTILIDEIDENGLSCYRIQTQDNEILWIQKASFLISKIEENRTIKGIKSKTITVYNPKVDIEIPEIDLQYRKNI